MKLLITILKISGAYSILKKIKRQLIGRLCKNLCLCYFLPYKERKIFLQTRDPVRYGAIFLAINAIKKYEIEGSFAEVGVYKGDTSKIVHYLYPERKFYLFDTFEGFPVESLEEKVNNRFKDTSLELVKSNIGDLNNIIFKKGYFPESTKGLEGDLFAFVMLDVDLYKPTLQGLEFFHPRLSSGGYIFIHDYNSPESDYAVFKAVNEFMCDKPEKIVEIPDSGGSVIIRRA